MDESLPKANNSRNEQRAKNLKSKESKIHLDHLCQYKKRKKFFFSSPPEVRIAAENNLNQKIDSKIRELSMVSNNSLAAGASDQDQKKNYYKSINERKLEIKRTQAQILRTCVDNYRKYEKYYNKRAEKIETTEFVYIEEKNDFEKLESYTDKFPFLRLRKSVLYIKM